MENVKLYEGAKAERSNIGGGTVIGQDTFVRDSNIGENVQFNRRNIIENSVIGRYTYTGANTIIKSADVGSFCSMSWNISMTGNQHDYTRLTGHPFSCLVSFGFVEKNIPLDKRRICVGNDVWIGANACILPGIQIGDGAVIGGGCVVTKDIPPYAIAVGNPAKIIKYRFSEGQIHRLLQIKWWDWPDGTIKNNLYLFQQMISDDVINQLESIAAEIRGV